MGLLAVLLAGGATADWLAPSLRPTLSAAVGRDVDTLLDARSPGARMAGALLTKVKKALSSGTGEKPGLENPTLANRDSKSRSRMIPGRPVSGEAPAGLVNEQIQQLLGPLAGLESQVLSPGVVLGAVLVIALVATAAFASRRLGSRPQAPPT